MAGQSIRYRLLGAFGVLIAVFGAGMGLMLFELQHAESERVWTIRRYEVLVAVQRNLALLGQDHAAQTHYVDTPGGSVAVAVSPMQQALGETFEHLGDLVRDDDRQRPQAVELGRALMQWRSAAGAGNGGDEPYLAALRSILLSHMDPLTLEDRLRRAAMPTGWGVKWPLSPGSACNYAWPISVSYFYSW